MGLNPVWRGPAARQAHTSRGSGRLRGPTAPSAPALPGERGDDFIQVEEKGVASLPGKG